MYKYGFLTLLITFCFLGSDLDAQRRSSRRKKKNKQTEAVDTKPQPNDPELSLKSYLDKIKELDENGNPIEIAPDPYTDTVIVEDIDFIDRSKKPVPEDTKKTKKKRRGKTYKKTKTTMVDYYDEYEEEISAPLQPLFETSFTSLLKNQKTDELIIQYGFMSSYSQPKNRAFQGQSFGIFSLGYRKNISDGAAIGFDIGYENINPKYLRKSQITSEQLKTLTTDNSSTLSYDQFFVMIYGKWIYKKLEFMELYSGAHVGFMSLSHNIKNEENHLFQSLAYQIDLGGLGFAITPNLKFYLEAGFGNMGKFKMGLAYMY